MKSYKCKLALVLLCMTVLTGCEKERLPVETNVDPGGAGTVTTTPEARRYFQGIRIGTDIAWGSRNVYSNTNGSVLMKSSDGTVFLAERENVSMTGTLKYTVRSSSGLEERTMNINKSFDTTDNGDFQTEINIEVGQIVGDQVTHSLKSIDSMNICLKSIIAGKEYRKDISYTNETLWDSITGLGNFLYTYGLSKIYEGTWSNRYIGGIEDVYMYDIAEDIVLEQI